MPFIEQEVTITGAYKLAGTLSLPEGNEERYPLILFIHGSGEVDRNENAKGMPINAFKELSDLAIEQGFATLRYDKRGIGQSGGDYFAAGFFDLVDDAVCALQFAKQHPQVDAERIILLGHSEGCLVIPVVHKKIPVQGTILLSGSAEPLAVTTEWQREQMIEDMHNTNGFNGWLLRFLKVDQKLLKMNDDLIVKIKNTNEDVIRFKGKKINAKWQREHEQFDVREYLPEIDCPVLAITGTKDVQVKSEQVKDICHLVQGPCEHHLIEDMTHLLRKTNVDYRFQAILKDYKKQVQQSVDHELKQIIARWLENWK
ncbi:MAG TPA: alpha/beta hydrolase [Bacillus sp. (in: firmicutes)]|nr:alpha/beta hydrolase [Bacillus sp. (in: firmicutes)]